MVLGPIGSLGGLSCKIQELANLAIDDPTAGEEMLLNLVDTAADGGKVQTFVEAMPRKRSVLEQRCGSLVCQQSQPTDVCRYPWEVPSTKPVPRHTIACDTIPRLTILLHAAAYHTMPCHAMPCHAMPCHAMPCHAMPCHAMPCHAIPCNSMIGTPRHTIKIQKDILTCRTGILKRTYKGIIKQKTSTCRVKP